MSTAITLNDAALYGVQLLLYVGSVCSAPRARWTVCCDELQSSYTIQMMHGSECNIQIWWTLGWKCHTTFSTQLTWTHRQTHTHTHARTQGQMQNSSCKRIMNVAEAKMLISWRLRNVWNNNVDYWCLNRTSLLNCLHTDIPVTSAVFCLAKWCILVLV